MTLRTKRRYAHELYPHNEPGHTRPLTVEVPYRYARAWGLRVDDTGWFEVEPRTRAGERVVRLCENAVIALLADALAQGLAGDEAWAWADQMLTDDLALVWERAAEHGIPFDRIKPYPCGPEPDRHPHRDPHTRAMVYVAGRESECVECTEEDRW